MAAQREVEDPVVVVGFSFRFPQDAVSEDAFWEIIRDGRSTMTQVPESRYNINGHHSNIPGRQDTVTPRGAHFIEGDISVFDAPFFKMSSVEAKAMDPQLRLLLETTYHAFESAGVPIDKVQGSNTSVYVSNLAQEYLSLFAYDTEVNAKYQATGVSSSMLSNRLSWFYDLRGPSISIDTACSSSLVGLHLGCQSLLQNESDMSVVGGVQLQLEPRSMTASLSRLGFLSPDGQCHSFDDRANGYSRGEGVGMVVLKRLSKAVADGDMIRGVIRGTSANQDGRTPSISQPSSEAQAALIRQAYDRFGLDYETTGYFEAHGTGTALGDPIEAEGISLAFSKHRSSDHPLHVGSAKANVGHLEPSAGIAGLIKTVLMVEKGIIPPNALLKSLNPRIPADEWHLKFPTSAIPWPTDGPRRASVNSFGFGGTNAHVVVDDALHYLQSRGISAIHNTLPKPGADESASHGPQPAAAGASTNGVRKHSASTDELTANEHLTNDSATMGELASGHLTNGTAANGHPNGESSTGHTIDDASTGRTSPNASSTEEKSPSGGSTDGTSTTGTPPDEASSNGTSVEGASTNSASATCPDRLLFLLSASDENGIQRQAAALESRLEQPKGGVSDEYLQDLAFTLSNKRSMLPWKTFALASSAPDLRTALTNSISKPIRATESPLIQFVFTGQGAQWASMGKELLCYPVFRESIEHADAYFRSIGSTWSLMEELYAPPSVSNIDSPRLAQPLCSAFQIALVDLLASWSVAPEAVVGHSSGEIAAAYCAGALDKDSALRVAYFRGAAVSRLLDGSQAVKGGMLAVGLSEDELAPYLAAVVGKDDANALTCGCVNSPKSSTVTGHEARIDELESRLRKDNVFARKLNVPIAYHSQQLASVADYYRETLEGQLKSGLCSPASALYSSVTGKRASNDELSKPEYWVANIVSQVKFSEALQLMRSSSGRRHEIDAKPLVYLLEVGPHCTLERPVRDTVGNDTGCIYDYTIRRNTSSTENIQQMAGRLATNGYAVDLQAMNSHRHAKRKPRMLLNLPKYAFNHSQSYWIESRLSKNIRSREKPRHELLGAPAADWNPLKPVWRFTIRESDIPWVTDHKINNTVLYPAAGMLVMVFEAIRSLTEKVSGVAGYRLRDISIGSALVVPSTDEGVEAQLHMSSHDSASNKGTPAFDFWIYSISGNEWKLHCSGQVFVEDSGASDEVFEDSHPQINLLNEAHERCATSIDKGQFYRDLDQKGANFGELFQTLHDICFNEKTGEAIASLPFDHWQRRIREGELTDHLIHPSTLDGLIHILFASVYRYLLRLPTLVPTQLSEVYVSRGLLADDVGGSMQLYGATTGQGVFSMDGDVTAVSATTGKPLVSFRGLRLLGVQAVDASGHEASEPTSLFHQVQWKPDIDFLSQTDIEDYCRDYTSGIINSGFDSQTELVCRHFLSVTLESLTASPRELPKRHLEKYVEWAGDFLEREKETTAAFAKAWAGFEDDDARPRLIEEFASSMAQKQSIVSYGRKLLPILTGEIEPLEILFNDGLAENLYQSPLFSLTANRVAAYMELLAYKASDIRIIEVGAGTGSTTTPVLEALSRQGRFPGDSTRAAHYDFTDISPSFFAGAQEKYAAHSGLMRYKVLDIERDPEEQGFELGSYDVVIAGAVLHATTCVENSLLNVKKLLKPGGQLVFAEPTNRRTATIPYAFGVLPGWWLSTEDWRPLGPLLTRPEWNDALLRTGFNGLQVSLADDDEEKHSLSLLVSSLPSEPSQHATDTGLSTVVVTETPDHDSLASSLKAGLVAQPNDTCDIVSSSQLVPGAAYDQCICLMEVGNPIMSRLTEPQFTALRHMVDTSRKIIWVTNNCGEEAKNPEAAMITGFAKTIARERPKLGFIHLNIQTSDHMAETILRVAQRAHNTFSEEQETDLVEENGVIFVPRVVEAPHINSLFDSELQGSKPQPVQVGKGDGDEALELRFSPGRLDSLHFGISAPTPLPLQDDQVRVSVKAAGINFKDVMVALNQVTDDHIGQEFAGVVTEAGAGVSEAFHPGARVCGIVDGSFRSSVVAKACHIMRMPDDMSFTEASAIPVAYATAQYGLHHLSHLQPRESILIHAAAGAVGQAAIQLAQGAGATVYVTVSTTEKKRLLMDKYGIDPSHFFSSRHALFGKQIMEKTGGRGVDVVLNSLAGHALTESWRCLAPFGRFIEIGKRDMSTFKSLPMEPFMRNVSFCSLDLAVVSKLNDPLMEGIMRDVQTLVLDGATRKHVAPYPLTVFKRSGFEEAFRLLQTGRHVGKVVVDWEQEDTVQVVPESPLAYNFDRNATYLIAGGLGGIGRNIATWMCRNGAKNLILLSRSGPKSDAAKELVTALEADGVSVYTPSCDVSDSASVEAVVAHAKVNMPPIKGCIQASMVVENRIFENYTLETFHSSMDSKVKGTFNLHNHLPPGMDFFVMLSSLAGVHGAGSQSNYAAANAFLDAFARFRHARGERCLALDLGIVESIGYIAERIDIAQNMAMTYLDHKTLREADLHFLLKWACDPRRPQPPSPWEAQVVAAITTPAFVRRSGVLQDHGWMRVPMFRHLYRMELGREGGGAAGEQADSAGTQLRAAESLADAGAVVAGALAKRLARSLAMPVEDIDVNRPPYAFGVDSLVAVELLFWFSNEIRADVPVVQILSSSTIAQLGLLAAEKSEIVQSRELKA